MMGPRTLVAVAAVACAVGFFAGREVGGRPVEFPAVDEGRSAEEMHDAVRAALHEPRGFVRAVTLTRLFEGLTEENVAGAHRAISARSGLGDPVDLQIFLAAWVELDPVTAVEAVRRWPVKSRREIGFNLAIREWAAGGHAVEAGYYVQTLEAPELQRVAFGPLVRGWALSGDYQGAFALTQTFFHDFDADVVDGFIRGMLQVEGAGPVLDLARQMLAGSHGPFQQRFVEASLNLAAREDPALAARIVEETVGEDVPPWLRPRIEDVARLYRTTSPREAIEWLLAFRSSSERDRAVAESMGFWAIRDYDAAWEWFQSERGPLDGQAELAADDSLLMEGLVRKMARVRPDEAARWVLRIREGEGRSGLLPRVAYFWSAVEPGRAEAWIDGLGLSRAQEKPVREAAARGRASRDPDSGVMGEPEEDA